MKEGGGKVTEGGSDQKNGVIVKLNSFIFLPGEKVKKRWVRLSSWVFVARVSYPKGGQWLFAK